MENISNMDYEFFFFYYLNWSIVNIDQESTHDCIWRSKLWEMFIVTALFKSKFK